MRALSCLLLIALASSTFAQECVTETDTYQGRSVAFETCTATIDDAVKANHDGDRFVAYIVKWKGQRIVVTDIESQSDLAVGDKLSFIVLRMPLSSDATTTQSKYLMFYSRGMPPNSKGHP